MFRVYVETPDGLPQAIAPSFSFERNPGSISTIQSAASKLPITAWHPSQCTGKPPLQSEQDKGLEMLPLQTKNHHVIPTRFSVSGKRTNETAKLSPQYASRRPKSMPMRSDKKPKHIVPVSKGGQQIHFECGRPKLHDGRIRLQASTGNTSTISSPSKYTKFLDLDLLANCNTRPPQRVDLDKLPVSIPSYLDRTIARTRNVKDSLQSFSDEATRSSCSPTDDIPKAEAVYRSSNVRQTSKATALRVDSGTLSRRRIKLKAETITC